MSKSMAVPKVLQKDASAPRLTQMAAQQGLNNAGGGVGSTRRGVVKRKPAVPEQSGVRSFDTGNVRVVARVAGSGTSQGGTTAAAVSASRKSVAASGRGSGVPQQQPNAVPQPAPVQVSEVPAPVPMEITSDSAAIQAAPAISGATLQDRLSRARAARGLTAQPGETWKGPDLSSLTAQLGATGPSASSVLDPRDVLDALQKR